MVINCTVVEQEDVISDHVINYYENLYQVGESLENDLIEEVIPSLVTDLQNATLVADLYENEIYMTIHDMSQSSALGPNDFGGIFFKSCWDILSLNLWAFVRHFFVTGTLLENFNSIHVILILKAKDADKVELFRPISLANFPSKLITKILADRLSPIAPDIISP